MLCPACKQVNLSMTDRQGIEIDYCPQCRGVWLDRGELDRLIERAEQPVAQPQRAVPPSRDEPYPEQRSGPYQDGRHPKKRKSMLGELFDF